MFYKLKKGRKFGEKCSFAHRRVEEQPSKWSKMCGFFEGHTAIGLCISRHGAAEIFIDFTEELNHAETNPMCSLHQSRIVQRQRQRPKYIVNRIYLGDPHQRNPNAPKFEDRSQEETEWQEHWAREATWKLAKKILKLKEEHKSTFFSPTEKWCLSCPSKIKQEEREFIVDSGASMHMISRKDWTVTTSRCPMTVTTDNGEVQTHEEATVYVKELDIFFTVKLLEDTPAVLSRGKLCEDHGYSYEWTNGQQPCLIKNDVRLQCNTENYVPIAVSGLSTNSSSSSSSGSTSPTSLPQESTGSAPITASIECESADEQARSKPSSNPTKNPKPNKDVDHEQVRGDLSFSEIRGCLQEFNENLVEERVSELETHMWVLFMNPL